MLLELTHETDLDYDDVITESVMELRVTPRQEQDQLRLSFELAIGPAASVSSYFDWMGNTVHTFNVAPRHDRIRIVAKSVVETDRPGTDPRHLPDAYPVSVEVSADPALYDFLRFGGPVVDASALRDLVAEIAPTDGEPLGEVIERVMEKIHTDFLYEAGVTTSASPITDILQHRKGVCQDFTHLMIGLARAMGVPARYVSGLVHPEDADFRGASETHAWVELLFPSTGWVASTRPTASRSATSS